MGYELLESLICKVFPSHRDYRLEQLALACDVFCAGDIENPVSKYGKNAYPKGL